MMPKYKWTCQVCGSEFYKDSKLPVSDKINEFCYKTRNRMIETKFDSVNEFDESDIIMCKYENPVEVDNV